MRNKKYKFFIFSPGAAEVKQWRISGALLWISIITTAIVVLFSLALGGVQTWRVLDLSTRLDTMSALEEENLTQKVQIQSFTEKIETLETQMIRLHNLGMKLRLVSGMEGPGQSESARDVGGPSVGKMELNKLLEDNINRQVRRMEYELEELRLESVLQEEGLRRIEWHLDQQSTQLASSPSIWPVNGWVTSGFGYRRSPFTGARQFHAGLDVSTPIGTDIIAPAEGVVTRISWEPGFGRFLTIDHGSGVITRYGHLSQAYVKPGRRVKRGEVVAAVGNSGRSTGPHLHYEVLINGIPVNPLNYILN